MEPRRAVPPPEISPLEFFTRWVPERVAADAERRARLGGTSAVLEFELDGEDGGHYHVVIVEGSVRGHPGPAPAADLRVELDVTTWRRLNAGELSAPEAFVRRRVRLAGDLRLAVQLHVILS